MTCTKTGCHAYLAEYQEYVYGDAYEIGGVAVLRVVQRSFEGPIQGRLHYSILTVDEWFDKGREGLPASTLISANFINHGYDGKELPQ